MGNRTDVDTVFEPVAQWQNFSGTDFLKLFFDSPIRMMERSIYSGYACFLATSEERGEISEVEYALAQKWFEFMDSKVGDMIKPDLIVYIRCNDVDLLQRRIKRRARSEEANVDPAWLRQMKQKHEEWLYYKNSSYPLPAKVLVVDGTLSKEGFLQELRRLEP